VIPAVEVVGVARRFGTVQALAGVDLAVEQGEFFGLLGPNGAGKTTLISIIAGLLWPTDGAIEVLGQDLLSMTGGGVGLLKSGVTLEQARSGCGWHVILMSM